MKKTLTGGLSLITIAMPFMASANTLGSVVQNLMTQLLLQLRPILVVASILVFIIAAYYYLTAGGDAEKVSSAHKMIIWGIVGLIVGLMAGALAHAICQIGIAAGGNVGGAPCPNI